MKEYHVDGPGQLNPSYDFFRVRVLEDNFLLLNFNFIFHHALLFHYDHYNTNEGF